MSQSTEVVYCVGGGGGGRRRDNATFSIGMRAARHCRSFGDIDVSCIGV